MPTQILMPALSPTMEEGTLAKWLVKEGDTVKSGDVMAEIETDKATMEFEAVDEGVIGKILVAEGTEGVKVNAPIAVLLGEGEDASAASAGGDASPAEAASAGATPSPEALEQSGAASGYSVGPVPEPVIASWMYPASALASCCRASRSRALRCASVVARVAS